MSQLGRPTDAERILLHRRRRGQTQGQAAAEHGLSRKAYGSAERRGDPALARGIRLGNLRPHERCLLYRRRVGRKQREVAVELRCSRFWINLMERGEVPCDDLLWYWEQ